MPPDELPIGMTTRGPLYRLAERVAGLWRDSTPAAREAVWTAAGGQLTAWELIAHMEWVVILLEGVRSARSTFLPTATVEGVG